MTGRHELVSCQHSIPPCNDCLEVFNVATDESMSPIERQLWTTYVLARQLRWRDTRTT